MRDKRVPGLVEEFERLEATKRKPATVEAFEAQDTGLKGLPDIAVPDTSAAVPEQPGRLSERIPFLRPTPNPEEQILTQLLNLGKGAGQLVTELPQFFVKDLPEALAATITRSGKPGIGTMAKEMTKDTAKVIAATAMRQLNPEEYERWKQTPEGQEVTKMIYEEPLRPLMAPLIFSGAARGVAKKVGVKPRGKMPLIPEKVEAPRPVGIKSDIIPKERIPTERVPILDELLGLEKPKVAKEITVYRGITGKEPKSGKVLVTKDKAVAKTHGRLMEYRVKSEHLKSGPEELAYWEGKVGEKVPVEKIGDIEALVDIKNLRPKKPKVEPIGVKKKLVGFGKEPPGGWKESDIVPEYPKKLSEQKIVREAPKKKITPLEQRSIENIEKMYGRGEIVYDDAISALNKKRKIIEDNPKYQLKDRFNKYVPYARKKLDDIAWVETRITKLHREAPEKPKAPPIGLKEKPVAKPKVEPVGAKRAVEEPVSKRGISDNEINKALSLDEARIKDLIVKGKGTIYRTEVKDFNNQWQRIGDFENIREARQAIIPAREKLLADLRQPKPAAKEPWEMTVKEYKETVVPTLKGEKLLGAAFAQDGLGRPTAHRVSVVKAIHEGKIKSHPDYPGLAKPKPQVPAKRQAPPTRAKVEPFEIPNTVAEGFRLWKGNKIYIDGKGNYRWKAGDKKGRVIPHNKTIKHLYDEVSDFHKDATAFVEGKELPQSGMVRPKPSERGAVLNIPKEIARPAGAEPVKYKEAIKTPDRPEMASMESYYKTIMAPEAFRPPAVEFAKQPGVARQIGIAERQTKGGKIVPAVRKAGTFVPEDFATYKNFKDAKQGVGGGTKDWIRYVQEIDGSLSLQKKAKIPGQAGPAENYILRRTEDMVKIELDWSAEQSLRIKEITKGLTEKQERLVTEVLEETSRPGSYVKTADFATNARIRKITSDTKVVKAAQESRKALEHWFSQQNKLRGLRNQELINYRQYYAPHILRETSLWERAFGGQVKAKEVVRGPQLPDYIKPNKPFNPRELAREIGLKNYMREMRIGKILEDYANTASRDIHHTSIIQNNKAFIQQLETMGYKNAAEGVGNFTAESFGGVKARLDRAFDFPVKVQKGMRFWRGSLMRSVFPLNWTWNTTVQTLSSGLTVMRTGITNSTRGLVDWFVNPTMRNKIKSSYSYRIKSRRGGRITRQDINTGVTEMVQGRRSAWQAAIDGANYATELVERHLTGWSVASGLRHGAKRGLKGKALWDYASDTGAKTQSMYNLENKPGMLRSEIVQTAAPFQTFIFEMYNTAKEFAGKTGTPPGAMTERIGWVLRFTAAAYAGNEMANAITGRRPWEIYSFIPFSDQTIKPVVDALRGKPYDAISGRGLPSFVGAGIQFAGAVRSYLRTGDTRKLRNWGLKYGTAFMKIPGGTQIARMVDGWIAVANEGMKDTRGRTLFKIKDPWEKARAIAMGPWRTKAGIEYWEKKETNILEDILGKPKKKKRLSIVPDLNAMRR